MCDCTSSFKKELERLVEMASAKFDDNKDNFCKQTYSIGELRILNKLQKFVEQKQKACVCACGRDLIIKSSSVK